MKKFSAKKGLLIFYGFDAVLILAVCFLLIPFNRKNSPDSGTWADKTDRGVPEIKKLWICHSG